MAKGKPSSKLHTIVQNVMCNKKLPLKTWVEGIIHKARVERNGLPC
jgi:hypothetical protein